MKNFIEICKKSQKQLRKHCRKTLLSLGYEVYSEEKFLYAPGEVPVLLVAHLDTVHKNNCSCVCVSEEGIVMSPYGIGGDDRCGVYMILEIVKELKCHVLFTEDEECGGVGASKFATHKVRNKCDVNYCIEFDRMGVNDAVYYDLDNVEFEDFISSFGYFKTSFGSYSDICDVAPALGVAAVNLSCGYFNAHTLHEYVDFNIMLRNIEEAKRIIKTPTEEFKWVEMARTYGGYGYYYGGKYYSYTLDSWDDEEWWKKYSCGYSNKTDAKEVEIEEDEYMFKDLDVMFIDKDFIINEDGREVRYGYYVIDEQYNVYELDENDLLAYWLPGYKAEGIMFDAFDTVTVTCVI